MMRRASVAMSRQLMCCSGSGQPVEFLKFELVRPSSFAFWFISSANCSSDPAIASANTMQASLPDCTMTPRIRSSTRTCVPTWTNIFDPPIFHARSLTSSSSSSFIFPCFSRS